LQLPVAVCRNGDFGFNECSRVYAVPEATLRINAMEKNWHVNGVKALGRQATYVLWRYGGYVPKSLEASGPSNSRAMG
jgi:hypothetical protein